MVYFEQISQCSSFSIADIENVIADWKLSNLWRFLIQFISELMVDLN